MRILPIAISRRLNLERNLIALPVHPLIVFCGVWLLTLALYAAHLSELLVFPTRDAARVVAWILLPFVVAAFLTTLVWRLAPKCTRWRSRSDFGDPDYLTKVEARVDRWFQYWLVLTLIEVIFSGGIPLLWLMRGTARDYTEFGLPLVHVLAGSLLSVIGLIKFGLWIIHGGSRRLLIPAFQLLWGVAIISRGLMVIALLQYLLLWICLKGVRLKTMTRTALSAILFVLMFGYIGDMRGTGSFRALARPTSSYPDWLPSGALWVYIYAASPLQNLVQTTASTAPAGDLRFPRTLIDLYPTPLRNALFGEDYAKEQASGDLIESSLNVSSAYVGPYRDCGEWGMATYSGILAFLGVVTWIRRQRTFRDQVLYVLIAECMILTIFWNFLFYNPFAGQFFWTFYLLRSGRFRLLPRQILYFVARDKLAFQDAPANH
jgi:hypothetical protein